MADVFTKSKRSAIMTRVKSENTAPEKLVFSYLRRNGVYFQKHYKRLAGSPDIALPRKKKAVFIDGDFWHGRHPDKLPNHKYWKEKIAANVNRDIRVNLELDKLGWHYIRVWESDLMKKSSSEGTLATIRTFLLADAGHAR